MSRAILNQATSADHNPVPGFALTSITSMTHEGVNSCKQLEEYLLSKLSKDHSGVKLKVLKIIRYACENDCAVEFRRLLQRRSDLIRQAQSYRGESDPLHGDAYNKAVREEASAALKALFALDNMSSSVSATTMNQSRRVVSTESIGNDVSINSSPLSTGSTYQHNSSSTSNAVTSSYAPRRMESMGNPYFDNYGPESPSAPSLSSLTSIFHSDTPGKDIMNNLTLGVQSVVQRMTGRQQGSSDRYSVGPMGGGQSSTDVSYQRSTWTPPIVVGGNVPPSLAPQSSSSVSCSEKLVTELSLSGSSARTVVPRTVIEHFVQKAEQMDGSELGEAIACKLADARVSGTQKIKILSAIEALHAAGLDAAVVCCKDAVSQLAITSVSCGSRAKQVLRLIEGGESAPVSKAAGDLLDLGTGLETGKPGPTTDLCLLDLGVSEAPQGLSPLVEQAPPNDNTNEFSLI